MSYATVVCSEVVVEGVNVDYISKLTIMLCSGVKPLRCVQCERDNVALSHDCYTCF